MKNQKKLTKSFSLIVFISLGVVLISATLAALSIAVSVSVRSWVRHARHAKSEVPAVGTGAGICRMVAALPQMDAGSSAA